MEYLDRALVISPYHIGLCVSERKFQAELRRLRVPQKDWPEFVSKGSHATTHFFESDRALTAIVGINVDKSKTFAQIAALLAHESVHVWRAVCESLGEEDPSEEFEAYAIQNITQSLIQSYQKQVKK